MIDQINKLIAINLFLIFASENDSLHLAGFKNTEGVQLPGAKMLAEIMQQKELIKIHPNDEFRYQLTELGQNIAENGGWLTHLEKLKSLKKSYNYEFKKNKNKDKNRKLNLVLFAAVVIIAVLCLLIAS